MLALSCDTPDSLDSLDIEELLKALENRFQINYVFRKILFKTNFFKITFFFTVNDKRF